MLTIKWLLKLVQLGNRFTTIKGRLLHDEVAPKHGRFLCFTIQGIAYE